MSDHETEPLPTGAAPMPVEESLSPLFDERSRAEYVERMRVLAQGGPDDWDGLAFPAEFALELAAVCNLRCVMCPVPTTKRPELLMDDGLARSVLDQIADEKGFAFFPQGFGESMLHARWADLLAHAVARGIRPIVMLTNGTLLNERNVDRLLGLDLDALVISIDGVTPATYAAVRVGGQLERVEVNVRRLLERRGAGRRPKICMRIIRMRETAAEIADFFARWRPLLGPEDEIRINEYNDWAGKVEDHSVVAATAGGVGRSPCRMLWRNLSVHADGKVSACCHDSEDELIVGDLASGETIQEIWQGERLGRLRRLHRENRIDELPICKACRNWY